MTTTLRALECLVTVARTGSVSDAALELHASQPAVSHQLAALERAAGTPLFERLPRGMRPTAAGRAALGHATAALAAADAAVDSARAAGRGGAGRVRLGCAQSMTVGVLAPVLRQWHRRRPGVEIVLHEATTAAALVADLEADRCDLVVVPGPVTTSATVTRLGREQIVLALPRDHPLATAAAAPRVTDLDDAEMVHYAADNGFAATLDAGLAAHGVRPRVVTRTSTTSTAPQLAAAGLGVAVAPAGAVGRGFTGVVREFRPAWHRDVVAVTAGSADRLVGRFLADLVARGVPDPTGSGAAR